MFKKELRVQEEPINPKEETIKAAPRIVPLASDPDKPAPGPEKETLHQPGIIFSGLKEKLTSEELLKRME